LSLVGCSAHDGPAATEVDAEAPGADAATAVEAATPETVAEAAAGDEGGDSPPTQPLVVLPGAFTTENAPLRMLQDGDSIDLLPPLQGGHVAFLAAQVKHTTATAATLHVRLRRPETGFIVAEEKRTVAMLPVPGEVDTMQPDLRSRSQVAQPPLCPDYDAIDIEGQPLDVEFEVTPLYVDPPETASAQLRLVPRCSATTPSIEALCHCECAKGYTLGKCTPDARAPLTLRRRILVNRSIVGASIWPLNPDRTGGFLASTLRGWPSVAPRLDLNWVLPTASP
jgi:hypothetical protein